MVHDVVTLVVLVFSETGVTARKRSPEVCLTCSIRYTLSVFGQVHCKQRMPLVVSHKAFRICIRVCLSARWRLLLREAMGSVRTRLCLVFSPPFDSGDGRWSSTSSSVATRIRCDSIVVSSFCAICAKNANGECNVLTDNSDETRCTNLYVNTQTLQNNHFWCVCVVCVLCVLCVCCVCVVCVVQRSILRQLCWPR